ncbi:hypothetical protein HN709_04125 [Candidatus Peregrinibacteria bacterium]|nr:hypothetical protein [Candidatus Peregrinibacteria bacterium]MBT7736851.1 hypothetical protein [Candidatus Peregrinibacteria bacterium]
MEKNCKQCGDEFEVTDGDLDFYKKASPNIDGKKFGIPSPKFCPDCRNQRRLVFRNERNLYRKNCDLCKKSMIAVFDDKVSFPVYCGECWWSDKWDPMKYGMDFDFDRSFFEQFKELMEVVPKVNLLQLNNENCEYNNLVGLSKNTYMSPGSYCVEDCYYCRKSQHSRDCVDCNFIDHSELLIACINCNKCYGSRNLINCNNCRDCAYLADSTGCENCFMCASVSRKKYCIKNKQYSKDEYEKIVSEKLMGDPDVLLNEFLEFSKTIPKKALNKINCEKCTGDYIQNCKNSEECYDCFDLEDCKYLVESVEAKDCMDMSMHDKENQLCYEISAGGEKNNLLRFTFCSCVSYDSDYLYSCFYLTESLGCDGFHSKQKNCILNKKYSEEEYKELRRRIIEKMLEDEEYGEFFPTELSLHAYNETVANEYYPMTKDEVVNRGWRWREKDHMEYKKVDIKPPERIGDVTDDILNSIFGCDRCGRNYKVLKQELGLLRKLKYPVSKHCPECRHLDLLTLKNPRKLWDRECARCEKKVQTTYSPEREEPIFCEKCYLKEVY